MNPLVIFVGDKPSSKNLDPAIPFLGTSSGERLREWLRFLDYSPVAIVNQAQEGFDEYIKAQPYGTKMVALGNIASKRLQGLVFMHLKLPHPSGRNRKLNDSAYVDKVLKECYFYMHGKEKKS